jgi:hypothetical protein
MMTRKQMLKRKTRGLTKGRVSWWMGRPGKCEELISGEYDLKF